MTQTATAPAVNPAALLKNLKTNYQSYKALGEKARQIKSMLFVDTYLWCEAVVATGKVKTIAAAYQDLCRSLNVTRRAVEAWYYTGQYMRQHKIRPDAVEPSGVRAAAWSKSSVTKSASLKILSAVKKGAGFSEVDRMVKTDHRISGHAAVRRSKTAKREGRWSRKDMRIELMAVQTVMKDFFEKEVQIAVCDMAGNILLEVGGKKAKTA